MDQVSTPPDLPRRASSAELTGSRPKPFDEDDASSRKRRRTSGSLSPGLSSHPAPDAGTEGSPTLPIVDGSPSSQLKSDVTMDSVAPSTPEPPPNHPPPETPGSKVTINLRSNLNDGTASPSTASPTPDSRTVLPSLEADVLQESVEDSEVELVRITGDSMNTPQSASAMSASPAVEVITVPDDDDEEMDFDPTTQAALDPTSKFPYNDGDETLSDTVHRLTDFLSSQNSINEEVFNQVLDWMKLYLGFVRHAEPQVVLASCQFNRTFWLALPQVLQAMASRKPSLLRSPALGGVTKSIYASFAALAATFIVVDCRIANEARQNRDTGNGPPELYSLGFLLQLHALTDDVPYDIDATMMNGPSVERVGFAPFFLRKLFAAVGGGFDSLQRLAVALVDLVPTYPKLMDALSPICLIIADAMREQARSFRERRDISQARQQLETGHQLWSMISTTLGTVIEKHITSLSSNGAASEVHALSETLRYCLVGDHKSAVDRLEEHRIANPELAHSFTREAIAWEWRFSVLEKLIRSSQMQLRVMAVTTMCNELVSIWKRLGDTGDMAHQSYLKHVGNHLLESSLLDYILGPTCHPEIIFESANIVGFLVVTKMYQPHHTDKLWEGIASSQDPRIADALTRMISAIVTLFDYKTLVGFCQKLQTHPIEQFTPAIRALWSSIMITMVKLFHTEREFLGIEPYSLCLRLLREATVYQSESQMAYPEIHGATLQSLKELLGHGPDQEDRQKLISNCISDISAKSPTTLGSLWFLSLLLRPPIMNELGTMSERHNLTALIVEEFEHAIKLGSAMDVPMVLCGALNHPRRDFITSIIHILPDKIQNDLGVKLWNMLVGPKASCREDRMAGWQILLNIVRKSMFQNTFTGACLARFLPALPVEYYSEGMLDFIREHVIFMVDRSDDFPLDDSEAVARSGIEHLWKVILTSEDEGIANRAIHILAVEVYIQSLTIIAYPFHRARQVHLSLVNRCLSQLKGAARLIKDSTSKVAGGKEEMDSKTYTDKSPQGQERVFIRSLQLLRYFLGKHQADQRFAAPDLRSLMSKTPQPMEGDPAELKYQSFDGVVQTEVKPLHVGKRNTAASLLASLRQETGFENYRVYYRGRPFLPTEYEICRSLEDLHVHDGLMLVKREADGALPAVRIKPGSSPLEIQILSHSRELWECLSMEGYLAKEIYSFLVKIPADGHVMDLIEGDTASHKDIFPAGELYKSLYALHAVREHVQLAREASSTVGIDGRPGTAQEKSLVDVFRRSLSLIVEALSDEGLVDSMPEESQLQLLDSFMTIFLQLLQEFHDAGIVFTPDSSLAPPPSRLVGILTAASKATNESATDLVSDTMTAILRLGLLKRDFWHQTTTISAFRDTLQQLILFDTHKSIRGLFKKMIEDAVDIEYQQALSPSEEEEAAPLALTQYFWSTFSTLLVKAISVPERCQELFKVLQYLIFRIANKTPGLIDFHQLAYEASELLLAHSCTERIEENEPLDPVADGLISLLHMCIQLDGSPALLAALPIDLAQNLLYRHLFPPQRSHTNQAVPPVVLNSASRGKLCTIISYLVRHDGPQFKLMLESMNKFVPFYTQDDDEPYLYDLPYQFERSKNVRSACGYVGLRNLSNTCYLNSLLTQLFMNTSFRRFLLDCPIQDAGGSQRLLFYTQKLFAYMQDSYRRFVDPNEFVGCIKTYDDAPVDIHNQMDVDEFYSLLFDRWEDQMLNASDKKQLRSFYGGQLVQQVKSKECEHISERLEPFSAIQCDIKGKGSLKDSLQAYVDGEIMEGDNKYKCSTCDRHVDAVKRACLKDIPDNLIFHLKRFDFNLRTLQRNKINDYFAFPAKIDMHPYTIEHLSNPVDDGQEDVFELVGVLVHSGTAESGHYYSYIKERRGTPGDGDWIDFNDDVVTQWDPSLLESSTFGGYENRPLYEANGMLYDKSYSAYMLFYQRASSLRSEREASLQSTGSAPPRVDLDPEMKEHILNENTLILRRHCLFDPTTAILVQNSFQEAQRFGEHLDQAGSPQEKGAALQESGDLKQLAMTVTLSYLDQVASRTKELQNYENLMSVVRATVGRDSDNAFLFYEYFHLRAEAFRAMLQRNPEPKVRTSIGQTLLAALRRVAADLPNLYNPPHGNRTLSEAEVEASSMDLDRGPATASSDSVIEGTMLIFSHLWKSFQGTLRSWDDYFGTVLGFAQMGHRETAHVLADDYLFRALRIVAADMMLELPPNYVRMLNNVMRRTNTKPPSYIAVIALIDYLLHQLEPVLGPECIVEDPRDRLEQEMAPFWWTAEEVQMAHDHPERQPASFFVEKLLGIDQGRVSTHNIIGRFVKTGPEMDAKVYGALEKNIQGATTTQPMDAFIRAAGTYLEHTESTKSARSLIMHVCSQARHLQNNEGLAFLDFLRVGLNLQRVERDMVVMVHDGILGLLPDWAPPLLVYNDAQVRSGAEDLIEQHLFLWRQGGSGEGGSGSADDADTDADADADIDDGGDAPLARISKEECVQRLGLGCLRFLRDAFVKRKTHIGRESATTISRVLTQCTSYYEFGAQVSKGEFEALHEEIMGPLRRLVVDEVEDDGSEWDGSCGSSDALDFADISSRAVKNVTNVN
ncbi:hypothetical protein B0I35DRAFT_480049 [Stachybotrys elegans]|uniref:USP domain-containing protein n=1 Tax=Stachybotrys elegans TaxID=80388 RepID=A0A8K0SIH4_9HYPO|nr:hypothetical protein B0I35DRAFT_480049 [Stachybotrys elegans]